LERKTELGSEKCYSKKFFHADSADSTDYFEDAVILSPFGLAQDKLSRRLVVL